MAAAAEVQPPRGSGAAKRQPGGIRVFVADDHPVVRRGLGEILSEEPNISVCAGAATSHEVLEHLRRADCGCNVLCLDLGLPGGSGLDLLHQIKAEWPSLPVLVVSMHPEEQYGMRVLRAGAAGYLMKDATPDQLVQAVRRVHSGGMYVSATLGESLAATMARRGPGLPHESLSDREFQVLCLLGRGRTVKQVGLDLRLSEKTVSTYRTRLMQKLGRRNTAELIRYAIENHLVD